MRARELIIDVGQFDSTEQLGYDLYKTAREEIIRLISALPTYADDDLDKPGAAFVPGADPCFVAVIQDGDWCAWDMSWGGTQIYFQHGSWNFLAKVLEPEETYGSRDAQFYSTEQSALAAIERMKGGA